MTKFTEDDAAALRRAIATGAKRVRVRGEETEFRSMIEMRETLAMIERELRQAHRLPYRTIASVRTRP